MAQKAVGWKINKGTAPDTTTVAINSTYLLLGTLNDHSGRIRGAKPDLLDLYYPYEKSLMKFVDSLTLNDFKVRLTEKDNCYFSKQLSNKMSSFYDGNNLKDTLLHSTVSNKLSFLTGVYYRYGEKVGNGIYKIQMSNSPKHNDCYEILKQLKCNDIYFKKLDNYPTQFILYFRATDAIMKYFNTIESDKFRLTDAYNDMFYKNSPGLDIKKIHSDNVLIEHQKIIDLFK